MAIASLAALRAATTGLAPRLSTLNVVTIVSGVPAA